MSDAKIGYGSTFGIEDPGTPGTYDLAAEVTRISPPGWSRDSEEVTHLNSLDRYKEFIAALKEGTPCELEFNWIPTANDPMVTAFEADTGNYEITAPNGVRLQFSGFFTTYAPGEITNGKMTASATIQPTGKPTLVAAV